MKYLYCSNCGLRLKLTRKALPRFATIIDVVEYHECLSEPVEIDLTPVEEVKFVPVPGKNKFIQKLNELKPLPTAPKQKNESLRPSSMTSTADLRDRRFEKDEEARSTAPLSVLDQIRQIENSLPERELEPESEA